MITLAWSPISSVGMCSSGFAHGRSAHRLRPVAIVYNLFMDTFVRGITGGALK